MDYEITRLSRKRNRGVGGVEPEKDAVHEKMVVQASKSHPVKEQRGKYRREGHGTGGQKPCDLCARDVDLLVRCQIDSRRDWRMVCGRCWNSPKVAGGVVDGDSQNEYYRYGGLWKNLHRA